jgi:hypothetical protein
MEYLISSIIQTLPIVVRYVFISAASILVVYAAWALLSMLWGHRSQEGFAIRPFIIVDFGSKLANGEIGFARILRARIYDLQKQLDQSIQVLERARAGDDSSGSSSSDDRTFDAPIIRAALIRPPGFFLDPVIKKTR